MGTAAKEPMCGILTAEQVHAISVTSLGLDAATIDLRAPEALAALMRYAASLSSPCSARALRNSVLRSLNGLISLEVGEEGRHGREALDQTIEALISYGDLLELKAPEDDAARLIYFAPPTFVALNGVIFLIGGQADGVDLLPSHLRGIVEFRSHTRRIRVGATEEVKKTLSALGWIELPPNLWLAAPRRTTPEQLLIHANAALSAGTASGEVPGLRVLDPDAPPTYYRGRWAEPNRKSGRFVARRAQRYGADLWTYVELSGGVVTKLVDLPLEVGSVLFRPCDAAWQLQMAIDAIAEHPQVFQLRPKPTAGWVVVDILSPVPMWARRRWDVLGEEVLPYRSLFAYRFPEAEFVNVRQTLEGELWLRERSVH
jgi:hypothetical protein